jgi:hypothetical protein
MNSSQFEEAFITGVLPIAGAGVGVDASPVSGPSPTPSKKPVGVLAWLCGILFGSVFRRGEREVRQRVGAGNSPKN